jgi:hypothetical protein
MEIPNSMRRGQNDACSSVSRRECGVLFAAAQHKIDGQKMGVSSHFRDPAQEG